MSGCTDSENCSLCKRLPGATQHAGIPSGTAVVPPTARSLTDVLELNAAILTLGRLLDRMGKSDALGVARQHLGGVEVWARTHMAGKTHPSELVKVS